MNLKKFIRNIQDPNLGHQERIYRLLTGMGLLGLFAGAVSSIVVRESIENIIVSAAAVVLFWAIVRLTIRHQKIRLGANIIGFLIIFLLLPVVFLTGGGIYGGSPILFLFGVVYVCLVVEGKAKLIYVVSSIFVSLVCYYIAYYYPDLIVQHNRELAYVDSFVGLNIVSVVICGMVLFQNEIYRSENERTQEQKKEIEELNRAQNNFFSSMSHEIRTPINTIIGLNEMILRTAVSEEVAEDAKNIQGASKMLLTLIDDILDMSKIESGKMEIVPDIYNVGAMLSDIVNMIWVRTKEKGLEFHIDVDQAVPAQMFGDEVRIKQILINVLNNAVKYTPEGSVTLSIQCRRIQADQVQITYSVTDTGIGIKRESIPYLFDVFKRIDTEKNRHIEGTGLGLSIVKSLVDLMGGTVSVNSIYTEGSTFVITLPQKIVGEAELGEIDFESRRMQNRRERYQPIFEAPRARILIVDDNETNLMVVQKLLRDTKVDVDAASSGQECLSKTLRNRYDVIFMDYLMSEMDGIECLHAVRGQTGGLNQDVPVVVLTANAGAENYALYKREGFDGCLLKPVTGKQLEAELLSHLPGELVSMRREDISADEAESPVLSHSKKLSVMISTDSVCDIPKALAQKYRIAVLPYRVLTDGGEFMDGVETGTDGILSYMGKEGNFVRAEAPAVSDYEAFFAEQLAKAHYIIHIVMAQNVSRGYSNALEASKTFDNVFVADSGHLCSGMGLVVLRAAECAAAGFEPDAIVSEIEQIRKRVRSSFIVNHTDYAVRLGHISSRTNKIFNTLMVHPVFTLKNSSVKIRVPRFGNADSAREQYIASALHVKQEIDKRVLFITYAGLTKEELERMKAQVESKVKFERIFFQKVSSAISTSSGPGFFGLFFTVL